MIFSHTRTLETQLSAVCLEIPVLIGWAINADNKLQLHSQSLSKHFSIHDWPQVLQQDSCRIRSNRDYSFSIMQRFSSTSQLGHELLKCPVTISVKTGENLFKCTLTVLIWPTWSLLQTNNYCCIHVAAVLMNDAHKCTQWETPLGLKNGIPTLKQM